MPPAPASRRTVSNDNDPPPRPGRPHIFSIAPERPFLASLAAGLLDMAEGDPLRLSRMTVLLPTRRAARSLREAFLRLTAEGGDPGAPLLLPRLRPVGDLDDDEVAIASEAADDPTLAIPPAIPDLRRRLLLTRLVLRWSERNDETPLLPGQAAALAAALARLLDTATSEGADFARLDTLAPAEHAAHWQTVLNFLKLLPQNWPNILEVEGALDPAERRNRLLRRQAEQWRKAPPAGPVIAAGLTGGIPALTDLVSAVAWMEQGRVVLAGLDRSCDAAAWEQIAHEPSHPQHLTAKLLADLEIPPEQVRDWPARSAATTEQRVAATTQPRQRRLHLAAEAMRPAAMTDIWRDLPPEPAATLDGLTRYDCASPQDEAITIALLLRRALEQPEATAALVTPDRELARRVAAELRRWGIDIDDSAGLPLNRTAPGAFLRLVLELADSTLAPVPLLATLKHPLAAGGLPPERFRDEARRLETAIRGPRPAPGFIGLRAALTEKQASLRPFVDRLERCLGALAERLQRDEIRLDELVAAHIAAAEHLAATDGETGTARLWREAAGEAAARFCHELIDAAACFPALPGRHYPALFEALAAAAVVRPPFGSHPRLAIWGLVEARLQQADLLVLGGLNEGTWPGPAAFDPWMSRQMRQEFGIAVPERTIGMAAHDFAQALGAPQVALTRATRREGAPTVPSRWLLRLDTVLRAVGLDGALTGDLEIEAAALMHDQPARRIPTPVAMPRPPRKARPRQLSVTQIETLIRDPYAIYARHILRLRALNELDADPGYAERGITMHDALARFVRRHPHDFPSDAHAELLAIGRECFGPYLTRPGVWAFWWPRFERIVQWFVAAETMRRPDIAESHSELKGRVVLPARGGPFTITAIADRIDRLQSGELVVIDYKTGTVPKKRDIEAGVAVQLPLEAAIARHGDFEGLANGALTSAMEYWRLSGTEPAGAITGVATADPMALVDTVYAQVCDMIDRYDDPAMPYLPVPVPQWKPSYSDYEHLERLNETDSEAGA
ncbi:MAG: double-strand break repair protein AddB [Alphaproteobacteria bacterium]|nr:double-strand break repair protein AddB [Alphaproteobacteria bacterium]